MTIPLADLLAQAHADPQAASVLDDWIEQQGGRYDAGRNRRPAPFGQMLHVALREAGDAGLRRSDLVLLAYRSRYPGCSVDEAKKHRSQSNVWITALLRQFGERGPDRRWRLRAGSTAWRHVPATPRRKHR